VSQPRLISARAFSGVSAEMNSSMLAPAMKPASLADLKIRPLGGFFSHSSRIRPNSVITSAPRVLVEESAVSIKPGAPTEVEPFLLDGESASRPSEFEIMFVNDGVRYQFGFSLDKQHVLEEWLYAYPKGNPQRWYTRKWNPETSIYDWDFSQKHFRGDRESLKRQTRSNALLLSTAAQLNHEQLGKVYRWFTGKLLTGDVADFPPDGVSQMSLDLMVKSDATRERVEDLLREADLGICGLDAIEIEFEEKMLPSDASREVREELLREMKGKTVFHVEMSHRIPGSQVVESDSREGKALRRP
jgi:hypothetical protein